MLRVNEHAKGSEYCLAIVVVSGIWSSTIEHDSYAVVCGPLLPSQVKVKIFFYTCICIVF